MTLFGKEYFSSSKLTKLVNEQNIGTVLLISNIPGKLQIVFLVGLLAGVSLSIAALGSI